MFSAVSACACDRRLTSCRAASTLGDGDCPARALAAFTFDPARPHAAAGEDWLRRLFSGATTSSSSPPPPASVSSAASSSPPPPPASV